MTCSTPLPGNGSSESAYAPSRNPSRPGNCSTPHANATCGNNGNNNNNSTMLMIPKEEAPISPCYGTNPCQNNSNISNNSNNNNNNGNNGVPSDGHNNHGMNGNNGGNGGHGHRQGPMNMTPQQFMMQMQAMAAGGANWNNAFMSSFMNGENGSDTGDDNR